MFEIDITKQWQKYLAESWPFDQLSLVISVILRTLTTQEVVEDMCSAPTRLSVLECIPPNSPQQKSPQAAAVSADWVLSPPATVVSSRITTAIIVSLPANTATVVSPSATTAIAWSYLLTTATVMSPPVTTSTVMSSPAIKQNIN